MLMTRRASTLRPERCDLNLGDGERLRRLAALQRTVWERWSSHEVLRACCALDQFRKGRGYIKMCVASLVDGGRQLGDRKEERELAFRERLETILGVERHDFLIDSMHQDGSGADISRHRERALQRVAEKAVSELLALETQVDRHPSQHNDG